MPHSHDTPADKTGIVQAKNEARARARQARDAVPIEKHRMAARELARVLLSLPDLAAVQAVLAYAALPSELDLAPAIWRLRERGARIAYPRIEASGVLGIHRVDDEIELVPGPFGLAEPRETAPQMAHTLIDAVIVPAVAYDERGARLGYGGGYYDRLLPLLRPDCVRIGVIFDEQLLPHVPAEEHDEFVDVVVTPTRVIRPGPARRL
jgi:5-formyltetrahydrofolate cyclo-ligase